MGEKVGFSRINLKGFCIFSAVTRTGGKTEYCIEGEVDVDLDPKGFKKVDFILLVVISYEAFWHTRN